MSWLSCSSKPKATSTRTAGGNKSAARFGGFQHTGGIGFDGGRLVISGLPEQTKQLFKEASKQKRAATGKGLTKRDVKHILKTYGAELRNPDALFAKAMLTAPPSPPRRPSAVGPPPVPEFSDSLLPPAIPPIPNFGPSASAGAPGGPPPVPSFNPAAFMPPSVDELERIEQEMERRVMEYEQQKQIEVDELRAAYDKLDGMYTDLVKTNESLEAELAVRLSRHPRARPAPASVTVADYLLTLLLRVWVVSFAHLCRNARPS